MKAKLWWAGARWRKKSPFFVTLLSEGNFLNFWILSQCIVYWINFLKIDTLKHQKTLLHTTFTLFLKSSKVFSVSFIGTQFKLKISLCEICAIFSSESKAVTYSFFLCSLKIIFQYLRQIRMPKWANVKLTQSSETALMCCQDSAKN